MLYSALQCFCKVLNREAEFDLIFNTAELFLVMNIVSLECSQKISSTYSSQVDLLLMLLQYRLLDFVSQEMSVEMNVCRIHAVLS